MTDHIFSKTERMIAGAALAVFSAGCFLVAWFNPNTSAIFPACPLLRATGYACPGCGLTRGFHALFHGDVWTALSYNALVPVYCFIFLYFLWFVLSVIFRAKSPRFNLVTPVPLFIFLGICLTFGVLRNLPFEPFLFFYP